MRIMIMTDSYHAPSGLGRVGRELALGLQRRGHEISYIGWFHKSFFSSEMINGIPTWFTDNGHFGSDVLDKAVNKAQPDILITIADMWNVWYITNPQACQTRRFFQWMPYIPVDGEPLCGGLPPGLPPIVEEADIPVAYTDYARNAVLKSCKDIETRMRIKTIYHGVNMAVFKPASADEKRELRRRFGVPEDKFVFLTVCRNQSRKNIPEMFRAWKIFSELPETRDKVLFWPHMNFKDPMGWDIDSFRQVIDLRNESVIYFNHVAYADHEMNLVSDVDLANIYRVADAFILLSGEGFGLPTVEAMASKVPCVLLDYAASSELGADGRAELVKIPQDDTVTWTGIHLTQRPMPNPKRVVDSMLKVYRDASYRKAMVNKAYEYVQNYTWDKMVDEWDMLIMQNEIPFLKPMELEVVS